MGVKYSSNENFFKTWSPKMAYVLGYLFADGSLEDASYLRGKYLRFTSIDKPLISLVKSTLSSKHKTTVLRPPNKNSHLRYFVRIGSHIIYNDLVRLGLHPNKSLTMKFPKVPAKYTSHFIRGYFDGDGHVSIEKKDKKFKKLRIVFVSGSKDFLNTLAKILYLKLNLKIDRIYTAHRSYSLAYSTSDSVKIFKYIYKDNKEVFLDRKYTVFKKFFLEYNKWVDKKVLGITSNQGHVVK